MHQASGVLYNYPNTFAGLMGKVRKKKLPKEEGREGGEKSVRSACGDLGSNPGPAAC